MKNWNLHSEDFFALICEITHSCKNVYFFNNSKLKVSFEFGIDKDETNQSNFFFKNIALTLVFLRTELPKIHMDTK